MARITISLPDALKDQLDATAEARNISVSELVQQALKNLFAAPPNPPPAPPPAPKPQPVDAAALERLAQLEKHVAALSYEAEHLRQGMGTISGYFQNLGLSLPYPPPIKPPAWPHTPPPWAHVKFK